MTGQTMIHGDGFVPCADIVYAHRKATPLKDALLLRRLNELRDGVVVIYSDTDHANRLNRALTKATDAQVVLITHNSDACIRTSNLRTFDADYTLKADCVRHWFGQNIDVKDEQLSPLPIGIERRHSSPSAPKEPLLRRYRGRSNSPNNRRHLLYVNHAVDTNPGEREEPYRLFEGAAYALVKRGRNGVDYSAYLQDLTNSAYCISPAGNGLDCHRTWEAMYLGCVPIVKRSIMSEALYVGLPVMLVDDYAEVNEVTLRGALAGFPAGAFAQEGLFLDFYRERIASACQVLRPGTLRVRAPRRELFVQFERWIRTGLS